MKNIILVNLLLSITVFGNAQTLSSEAEISVITCGPFQGELYSAFGHSAFRVFDPSNEIDDFYNYGVFDFDQPNFYLNFARGKNNYMLGVYPYGLFRDYYIDHNRFIHEQKLNLSVNQKQRLYDYLKWNAKPANRNYLYDYFYDNCATKIRDVAIAVFGDSIAFDGSYITTDYTIRDLTELYLKQQPWGDLGIDICLGLPMDKKASPIEYMFLPDYIESGFDHASLNGKPIVREKISVYESRAEEPSASPIHPVIAFSLLASIGLLISYLDFKRKKLSNWFDMILFSITGLIGLLLLLLWVATDHKAAAGNLNLLWALPTHLAAVIGIAKKSGWLKGYFLSVTILNVAVLIVWQVLPQDLNPFLIPFVILLAVRSATQFKLRQLVP